MNATGNSSNYHTENRGGHTASSKRFPYTLLAINVLAVTGLGACTTNLDDSYYQVGVWEQLWIDGVEAQKQKRMVESRRLLESAVEEGEQSKSWLRVGVTYDRLGDVYCKSNMAEDAEKSYQKALMVFKTYIATNKSLANEKLVLKEVVGTTKSLAPLLIEKKKFAEAEKLINYAIQGAERLGGTEMRVTSDRLLAMDYAENIRCLGLLYEKTNRFTEAERCYLRAARFMPDLLLKDRESRLLHTIVTLEHEKATGRTIDQTEKISKLVNSWSSVYDAGFEAVENQDLTTARERFSEAYLMLKGVDPFGNHTMESLTQLLKTMNRLQQFQDSEKLVLEIFPAIISASPSKPIDNVLGEMAKTCRRTRNWTKAEAILKHRLTVRRAIRGQNNIHVAETLNNLGDLYAANGRRAEAEFAYRKALKILTDCSLMDTDLANDVNQNIEALK